MPDEKKHVSDSDLDQILEELGMLDKPAAVKKPMAESFSQESDFSMIAPVTDDELVRPSARSPQPEDFTRRFVRADVAAAAAAVAEVAPEQPSSVEEPRKGFRWKQEIFEWVRALLFVAVPIFLFFTFVVMLVDVDGSSMQPTLQERDKLLISRVFYTPKSGDIVVISENTELKKPLIKRIIATSGQTLNIDLEGQVTVNGILLEEEYVAEMIEDPGTMTYPLTVPDGQVFVMGDNRNYSTDSRSELVGFVPEKEVMGKVLLRLYPINKFGTVK